MKENIAKSVPGNYKTNDATWGIIKKEGHVENIFKSLINTTFPNKCSTITFKIYYGLEQVKGVYW